MRISLLRAPKMPDPVADMGRHRFRYAIYPHEGRWQDGGVVAEALDLNVPFAWSAVAVDTVVSVDTPNLVLDTIKLAEREDALVLRLYEAHGARGRARSAPRPGCDQRGRARTCSRTRPATSRLDGSVIELDYRPFEIITLILRR